MLKTLTTEQKALCEAVAQEYIDDISRPTMPDGAAIARWLDTVYKLYDRKRPDRVEIVESPFAAIRMANDLTGEKQTNTDCCGVGECGWVAFYDFFHQIGVLTNEESTDLLALRDYIRVAWDTLLLDECAIVIQRPVALKLDDAGNLHCADGPAIEWADGSKDFAWHGTWVPERVIMNPRSYTREEYHAISNTEVRRALCESGGWQWMAEMLDAEQIDAWIDPKTSLAYTLLRCSDGQQLLAKQSPKLKDGSQPKYIEPVHEQLLTAQAARKWQALPSLTVAQCESDPELVYEIEA